MEPFAGLEVARVQPTPSPGAKGLKSEQTLTECLCTFQSRHKQPHREPKLRFTFRAALGKGLGNYLNSYFQEREADVNFGMVAT